MFCTWSLSCCVTFLKSVGTIKCVGTWPEIQTNGIESMYASVRAVTALVAPGPEVTSNTLVAARSSYPSAATVLFVSS